jgi:hypothetical protein
MSGVRRLGRAAVVAGAGGVWGLGLGRLLAEAALWPSFYTSLAVVSALVAVCAVAALGLWRSSTRLRWSSFIPLFLPLPYVWGGAAGPLAGGVLLVGGAGLAALTVWQGRPSWVLPALLGLVTLGVYLRTLLPSVGEADTFEFQVVVPKLGVAHPTGYPLYVLLGKLFTLLPLRNVAWRLNLASAVFGAAAVVVVYGMVQQLVGTPRPADTDGITATGVRCSDGALLAFLTALAFALSATFWSQALVAEVYGLHNLLVAVILWLLLRQVEPSTRPDAGWARGWQAVCFLLGLSLTNHLTTVLLIPAVLLAVLMAWLGGGARLRAKDWMLAAGLFVLGLSPYLFIPVRWPALHDGAWMTLHGFASYVTGGQFHGALRLDGWQDATRWRIVARLMLEPFGWVGLVLAAVGVVHWAVDRRRALTVTGVAFLGFIFYGLTYYVADIAVFLLPAHLVLAVWMGAGAAFLARSLSSAPWFAAANAEAWRPGLVALLALIPLSQLWTNFPAVDRSEERGRLVWGRYALRQPLVEDSAVLADPKRFAPLYYLQQIEGVRPDLDIVLLGTEELYQAELRRRLGEGQTVYLARYLPHLEGLTLRSVGPLAEVGGREPGVALEEALARLGERVRLLGVDIERDPLGRALYHVTLQWQAERSLDGDLVVRLRMMDADGRVPWATEGARPVNGLYPTNAWTPDVRVSDYHEVPIEPWLPPGRYSLQVGLFSPFGDQGLTSEEGAPWLPLGALAVEPPSEPQPLSNRRLVSLGGGAWLTGTDIPEEGTAGAPMTVDLAWRHVAEDERVQLAWGGGAACTSLLPAGMVRSRHTITAPKEAGLHTLYVWLGGDDARCGWLAAPEQGCPLGTVRVRAGENGLATFGDQVLLVEARVGRREAQPGEVVPVALAWRGRRTMEQDYTVFVHLVGPDGRLHGQVDSWPVQGTYPTSQWRPGEGVPDPHEVRVDADAPPGTYRVEVGLYLLETMERLRVMDEAGNPIADAFVVGTLDVSE